MAEVKDRAAAVQWLAEHPEVWSDRPRDDFEAEKAWCMNVLQVLCNEGFDLGSGGLNDLLSDARAAMAQTLTKVDEILCRVYPVGRGGTLVEKADFVVRMVINAGNYIRNLDPIVFENLTKDPPPGVRLEAEDGSGAVVIGGEPNEQTVKTYKVG